MAKYDVLIKNGTVFDGKGNSGQKVDIGVSDGKIKKIGNLSEESADTTIDASGSYVTPGFIDLTTHSDNRWSLFNHPLQESFIKQGVTTILGGNCGLSLAPFVGEGGLVSLEGTIDSSGINVNWQTLDEFFDVFEKRKLPLNFGTFVGLSTIHRGVMGEGYGAPDRNKLNQMKLLLDKSIKNGAFGLSTSFGSIYSQPLMDAEIIEMLKIVSKNDGISKHHLEDEGKNILPSLSQLINFSREAGSKLHISHLKALGKTGWGYFKNALEMIKNARGEGVKITCDFFPYNRTGSNLFMLLPSWVKKYNIQELIEIFRSKENKERKEIINYLRDLTLHYNKITIASATNNWENIVGKTINDLIRGSGLPGEEIILNLLLANDFRVSIFSEIISDENIKEIAIQNYSAVSSDGTGYDIHDNSDLPHPRSFGAFPRAMRLFVKDNKIMDWEEIIYKMTGLPASILSLKNRGVLEKGNYADIVIFNPDLITDKSDYDNPYQFPEGINSVLINGNVVFDGKKIINNSAGKLLKYV